MKTRGSVPSLCRSRGPCRPLGYAMGESAPNIDLGEFSRRRSSINYVRRKCYDLQGIRKGTLDPNYEAATRLLSPNLETPHTAALMGHSFDIA